MSVLICTGCLVHQQTQDAQNRKERFSSAAFSNSISNTARQCRLPNGFQHILHFPVLCRDCLLPLRIIIVEDHPKLKIDYPDTRTIGRDQEMLRAWVTV